MNFFNLLFLGKYNFYHKTHWYEALFAKVVGAGRKLIAKFLKIKGNTLVWNQLVQNGNFADVSAWQTYNCSYTVSNNVATITRTNTGQFLYGSASPIANHKYLFSCDIKSSATTALFYWNGGSRYATFTYTANQWNTLNEIFSISSVSGTNYSLRVEGSDSYDLRNCMLIDLTAMFGSTKADEIYAMEQSESGSGVAYFRSLFPLPYYQYEQGKLLSFNGSGIKTVGFNQWDEEWELGSINASDGQNVASDQYSRSKNYIKVMPNSSVYFAPANRTFYIREYGANKNFLRYAQITANGNRNFNVLSDVFYIRFVWEGTTYNNDICINISSSENGKYEPYQTSTLDIPTSTYFPNGMIGVGTAFDELTNSKAIKRIGSVDLGSLEWNTTSSTDVFKCQPTGMNYVVVPPYDNRQKGAVCSKYSPSSGFSIGASMDDKSWLRGGYDFYIRDSSYSDVTTFKNAMNGVMLQYELEEEQVVDIDPPLKLNYQVWEGGTEQLLPVNTDVPVTSPILADIEYPDGERDDQYFTYRQYLPNSRMMSMALNTIMGRNVEFNQQALDILMKGE